MTSIILLTAYEDAATIFVIPALLLTILTLIHRRQCSIAIEVAEELASLHARRVDRVRTALASAVENDWIAPVTKPQFPFEAWVRLTPSGVIVAGQLFNIAETFAVTAKDDLSMPRASVECAGRSELLIKSHGQTFRARYQDQLWIVEEVSLLPA